ncbi:MAG: hypothetical protein AB1806_06135 [Acidobacteriota bacterium]
MMFTSVRSGLQVAWRQPKLVFLLWAWNLILGLAVTVPIWTWLRDALDLTVEGPALLSRFNVGALVDLIKYADPNPFDLLGAGVQGAVLVAVVASAFTNGGMLEVLGAPDDRRTFMHRFFRGGGHFFWRFVRLMVVGGILALVAAGLAGSLDVLLSPLSESESGYGPYAAGLLTLAAMAVAGGLFLLGLDYARIRIARDDTRGMLRAYFGALGFVLRHAFATYGMAVVMLLLGGAVLLLYVGHETVWTTSGWGTILLLVVVQQVVVLARTLLRVALVAAERHYFLSRQPPALEPVVAPAPVASQTPAEIRAPAVEDMPPPAA